MINTMNSFRMSPRITFLTYLQFTLFLIISITGQLPLASLGCLKHERRALLDFKSSLDDPSNSLLSWQEGIQHGNCCHWHGIECSHDSFHVVSIDLGNRYFQGDGSGTNTALHGKLSPSLFNITHLEYLDLAYNDFQGSQIPLQFSTHLSKLTHLDLAGSNFSSSISTQFTNLTSLSYLDLSCDYSTSCLELLSTKWVRGLENLKVLTLSGVDLSKATSSQKNFAEHISHLSSLKYLDISDCSISTTIFPIQDYHNLSRLSTLKMGYNRKLSSEIPVQLANLTSLSILDLSDCGLQGSVPYLPQLIELDVSNNRVLHPDLTRMFQHRWPKLERLFISYTNVSGSIPDSISNAPLLVILWASSCSIQGSLPLSIYNLSRLQYLDLTFNKMTGYIQSSFTNMKSLSMLQLSYNNFQGPIPKSICKIFPVAVLRLDGNNITGTIPSCLTNLKNLTDFSVSGNSIGGTVSLIHFINGLNLTYLDLSSNRLTVDIDQRFHLYSKFKLVWLDLRSCNIEGLFPAFICNMTLLRYLDLSQNHIEGRIPFNCFSELQRISFFNLSSNKFHGPVPFPPQGYSPLFDLSNNKFSGEISLETGKRLSTFEYINLAGNELSGPIPFSICSKDSASSLKTIDLSNNKLSGVIPTSIEHCTDLFSLNFGTNNLTGSVPSELDQVKGLRFLQLNDNNLNGTPLNFISKFRILEVLNLANNNFGGSIPSEFGSLIGLRILSLRSNKFNRSIPQEINHLEKLQILDLSQNNFSGNIPKLYGKYWRGLISNSFEFGNVDDIQLQMVMIQFKKLYKYSSGIDLSCNMLDGNIPVEIGLLKGLATLNLSHNDLTNVIPESVGNMSNLGSLDLSFNRLSGPVPQSLTSLDFLGVLNLSYNELTGRIPRGNHFDTLGADGWAYVGNDLLCGEPTKKLCDSDINQSTEIEEDNKEDAKEIILFYGVIVLGFAVGFWGLFIVLLLRKKRWWFPYWRFVDSVAVGITCFIRR